MNKVVLIGRLTKDPEVTFAKSTGNAICNFSIAVNRKFKKEGQPDADFINCVTFGKTAENLCNYQSKGSLIGISGSIQVRFYEKNETKVYVTEILCDEVTFLTPKSSGASGASENYPKNNDFMPIEDGEDMPF